MFYLFVRTCNVRAIMIYTSCGGGDTAPHKTRVSEQSRSDHGGEAGSANDRWRRIKSVILNYKTEKWRIFYVCYSVIS